MLEQCFRVYRFGAQHSFVSGKIVHILLCNFIHIALQPVASARIRYQFMHTKCTCNGIYVHTFVTLNLIIDLLFDIRYAIRIHS